MSCRNYFNLAQMTFMLVREAAFSIEIDLLEMKTTRGMKTFKIWIYLADFTSGFIFALSIFIFFLCY